MKLKYRLIEKLHTLTRREFHLFLYACRIQDDTTGRVEGLYYRDVMKHTGMCKQSVYNALHGLEAKGIIRITGRTDIDCNIRIPDNDFPDAAAWSEGYVNLNREAFRRIGALKAPEIYLLLEFLKGTHEGSGSLIIGVRRLYKKYRELLGVTVRVIRSYLHRLKQFFSIGIKDGKYYITYLHSVFRKPGGKGSRSEIEVYREHLISKECRRSHIQYTQKELEDVVTLTTHNYRPGKYPEVLRILMQCIRSSAEGLRWKDRSLNPKYIHKLLRRALDLPAKKSDQRPEAENNRNAWNDPEPA